MLLGSGIWEALVRGAVARGLAVASPAGTLFAGFFRHFLIFRQGTLQGWTVHLTRQSDYGVRAMLHLANLPYGEVVQTREIAAHEDIPGKYLPSIIRTLARAGLIRTMRGNQGGVMLSRPPEEINLREVIEAIEGQILLVQCLRSPGQCTHEDGCAFLPVCENLQNMMVGQLEGTTFADLASGVLVETRGAIPETTGAVAETSGADPLQLQD